MFTRSVFTVVWCSASFRRPIWDLPARILWLSMLVILTVPWPVVHGHPKIVRRLSLSWKSRLYFTTVSLCCRRRAFLSSNTQCLMCRPPRCGSQICDSSCSFLVGLRSWSAYIITVVLKTFCWFLSSNLEDLEWRCTRNINCDHSDKSDCIAF